MKCSFFITTILATASEAGLIVSDIHQERNVTCGPGKIYTQSDIQMAVFGACAHMRAGTTADGTHYPHEFHNYESLILDGEGPYVAFPLLTDTIYNKGYPGRDRVVIGKTCAVAAVVTSIDKQRHGFRVIECNETLPVEIEAPRRPEDIGNRAIYGAAERLWSAQQIKTYTAGS